MQHACNSELPVTRLPISTHRETPLAATEEEDIAYTVYVYACISLYIYTYAYIICTHTLVHIKNVAGIANATRIVAQCIFSHL